MGRLAKKYEHLERAVASFAQVIAQYHKWQTEIDVVKVQELGIDYEGIVRNLRDSMIQRFEYSTDLLWKYLKTYLDEKLSIVPDVLGPNSVVREAGRAGLLSEKQTEIILEMIKRRNLTSHIYQEEIAEILSGELPSFYDVMQQIMHAVAP